MNTQQPQRFDPATITRPSPVLMRYYVLATAVGTLCILPITLIALLPSLFKFRTLRYRFDEEGISMAWGVLFRREINLTYRRIQDIHVSRNLIERWLGIGKVEIQTASGKATAELSIEGMEEFEAIRDFLYRKMRGTGTFPSNGDDSKQVPVAAADDHQNEVIALLKGIKDDLDGVRRALEQGGEGV